MGLINSAKPIKGSYAAQREAAARALAEQRRRKHESNARAEQYLEEAIDDMEQAQKKGETPSEKHERMARTKATLEYYKRSREARTDKKKDKHKI